jgi:hypothetical protein
MGELSICVGRRLASSGEWQRMSVFVVLCRGEVGDDLQDRGVFSSLGVPKVEGVEELDRWGD